MRVLTLGTQLNRFIHETINKCIKMQDITIMIL